MTEHEMATGGLIIRQIVVGELSTNCWILASTATKHATLIDPGDEPQRIIDAVSDLRVDRILLTHSHWDHVLALPTVADALGCATFMHPADTPVWPDEIKFLTRNGHFDAGTATNELLSCGCRLAPTGPTWDGHTNPLHHDERIAVGDLSLSVIHTPGHTPGGVSFSVEGHVFTGDTLFPGGPGLTGWPHSDFATIIKSISKKLFTLPDHTHVHPGHGASTTIGAERPHLDAWIARRW